MILNNEKKSNDTTPEFRIKKRHIIFAVTMLLALLAMISYSPQDWNTLKGGVNGVLHNWIGNLGAIFSHILLISCGIAGYILLLLFILRSLRLFLPNAGKTRTFFSGTLLILGGSMLLLALTPEPFITITHNLGLGHHGEPANALSGGLIGQFFAAPPAPPEISAGWLRSLIGMIGTMVIGWIMVTIGGVILYVSDWHELVRRFVFAAPENIVPAKPRRSLRSAITEPDESIGDDDETGNDEKELPLDPPLPKSRLSALLRRRENEPEEEKSNDDTQDVEIFNTAPAAEPDKEVAPVNTGFSIKNIAVAEKSAPAIIETPEVSQKVVRQGIEGHSAHGEFTLPHVAMLAQGKNVIGENADAIELAKSKIQQTLEDFAIAGRVTGQVSGPRVTRYEITLDPGINVKKVEQIQDNIRMALAATSIRVLAPIPGRSVVGIEVSNSHPEAVHMRSVMESDEWRNTKAEIPIALGKNVSGKPVILDLAKAPHMLVAGATGTGKSVCSNSLIVSLLFRFKPDELRLIMVDPKIVEFDAYKTLPHLLTPIINDSSKVPIALRWAANEMDRRYHVLAKVGVKKLSEFNSRPRSAEPEFDHDGNPIPEKMPLLVIILDELADLMMTEAKKDVETNITRIAQKGRAAGIHIIVATQRPSTNIITGVIKANLPTRLCFQVRSLIDSRVVLDTPGAEKLLGMGDMLVMTSSSMEIERVQGAFVKDDDIKKVVEFVSSQAPQRFNDTVLAESEDADAEIDEDMDIDPEDCADIAPLVQKYMRPGDDDTMRRALEVVILDRKASTSYIQRRLKIGYNRAAELVDQLEERGIVGPPSGSGNKREILIFDGIDIG